MTVACKEFGAKGIDIALCIKRHTAVTENSRKKFTGLLADYPVCYHCEIGAARAKEFPQYASNKRKGFR